MAAATTTIRVYRKTQETLRELAHGSGLSIQEVVEQALEMYRRQQFFDALDAAYAALRADPVAWQEAQAELAEWDVTLNDGLEDY